MSIQAEIDRIKNIREECKIALTEKGVAITEPVSWKDIPLLINTIKNLQYQERIPAPGKTEIDSQIVRLTEIREHCIQIIQDSGGTVLSPFKIANIPDGIRSIPIIQGVKIGTLPAGNIVKMKFNGVLTDFIIIHQGNPNSAIYSTTFNNKTWLRFKDPLGKIAWDNNRVYDYSKSNIYSSMNGFINKFAQPEQSIIETVKVPYTYGYDKGAQKPQTHILEQGISQKIFPMSIRELGYDIKFASLNLPDDGAKLDYYIRGTTTEANERRKIIYQGAASHYWTRSSGAQTWSGTTSFLIDSNGGWQTQWLIMSYQALPVFTVSQNVLVQKDGNIIV